MQGLGSSKAPDAFRTISEVAEDLDIPQHVLRFWETKFTAIRPLKRAGGRRYYRPDDVDLLKGIRLLLYGKGYTIKGVQRILKEDGPRVIQQVGRDGLEPSQAPARPSELQIEELDDPASREPVSSLPPLPAVERDHLAFDDVAERAPAMAAARPPLNSPPTIAQLRTVLADLYECRRILHSTKAG